MSDLISRQAAIDTARDWYEWLICGSFKGLEKRLRALPPAQPERKTGKWIDGRRMKFDGTFYWFRQCDQCGYERNDCDTEKDSNFCPDCGADMRQIGEQDGER